jgi:hypothetical protein
MSRQLFQAAPQVIAGKSRCEAGRREEALKHWRMTHQIKACELNLVGYKDEDN